jgi:thiol-disulfide isomerase/thioredoxin
MGSKPVRVKAALAMFLLLLLGATPLAVAKTPGEVGVGEILRDAPMQGLSGPSRLLSDYRGTPLIINVWASWCGPCRQEMASLDRLSRRHGGKQFTVIGISTDDYPDAAMGFLQKSGTSFKHFIDTRLLLENMLGANRIPLTILVDAKGRVLGKYYGAKEWDSPEALEVIRKTFRLQRN